MSHPEQTPEGRRRPVSSTRALAEPPTTSMPEATRWRICREVVVHRIDDEAVVYDPGAHEVLYLDADAFEVFKQVDGTRDDAAIFLKLAQKHGERTDEVASRFAPVLAAMRRHGWIGRILGADEVS